MSGTTITSCFGIKDLISLGLCNPHQLTLTGTRGGEVFDPIIQMSTQTPGCTERGVLQLQEAGDPEESILWSSLGTTKVRQNTGRISQKYAASLDKGFISVMLKKKLVWMDSIDNHPVLAAHL